MDQNEEFLYKIQSLLLAYPRMRWPAKGIMARIEAVKLPWWRIYGWKRETDKQTQLRLESIRYGAKPEYTVHHLIDLFINREPVVSILRKRRQDDDFDLYILARFGRWHFVGFKTKVLE